MKDFIEHYGPAYSPNELLRMELTILDKLHWDLYLATPLDFLTIVSMRALQNLPLEQLFTHWTAKHVHAHVVAHAPHRG